MCFGVVLYASLFLPYHVCMQDCSTIPPSYEVSPQGTLLRVSIALIPQHSADVLLKHWKTLERTSVDKSDQLQSYNAWTQSIITERGGVATGVGGCMLWVDKVIETVEGKPTNMCMRAVGCTEPH